MLLRPLTIILVLCCLLYPYTGNGQTGRYIFRNFSSVEGLPSSEVHHVFRDSKGFLWFATDHGAARFDGYVFEHFSAGDNSILLIYEDYRQRIWFISISGKLYFYEKGVVQPYAYNKLITEHLAPIVINDFYVDSSDKVFVSATNPKSYWIDKSGNWDSLFTIQPSLQYKSINTGSGYFTYLNSTYFISPHYYERVRDEDQVELSIQSEWGPLKLYFNRPSVERRVRVKRIAPGTLVAFKREELYLIKSGKVRWKVACPTEVLDVAGRDDGSLIVATSNMGLLFLDTSGKVIDLYLDNMTVSSIEHDLNGGFWASTTNDGVYFLPGDKVSQVRWNGERIRDPVSFLEPLSADSSLWIGTIGSRLYQMNWNFKIDPFNFPSLHQHKIRYDTASRQYLLGVNFMVTLNNGYFLDEVNNERINGKAFQGINSIAFFKANGKWYGANSMGVFQITGPHQKFVYKVVRRISTVFQDHLGRVWMGTPDGLWEWKKDSLYAFRPTDTSLKLRITHINEFRNRIICLGTRGGGLILLEGDRLYKITRKEGLPSDNIRTIHIYNDQIWLGTNNGLAIIQFTGKGIDNYTIRKFNADDGLLSNEINAIAAFRDKIYLGTQKGLFQVETSLFNNSHASPLPFYLRSVKINGQEQEITNQYNLSRNKRNLELSVVALDYQNPTRIQYRYRIGDGENWLVLSGREIQFNQLPYGRYEIELQAKREFDDWGNAAGIKLQIINKPPFWATIWFILTGVVIAAGSIYGLVRWRIKTIREREREELSLQKKMAATEIQAIRAQMNPHFIFNALNSIQYFISYNKTEEATRHLASFAQMVRKILDSSRELFIPIADEIELLRLYLAFEKLRFEDKFDFVLETDPAIQTQRTLIPNMAIQPFVENAIKHGFKGLTRKGVLEVRFTLDGERIVCTIQDNGIGRERAALSRIQDVTKERSLGTIMIMEKKEALARLFQYNMEVNIRNRINENGEEEGTLVEVIFPIQKRNLT